MLLDPDKINEAKRTRAEYSESENRYLYATRQLFLDSLQSLLTDATATITGLAVELEIPAQEFPGYMGREFAGWLFHRLEEEGES